MNIDDIDKLDVFDDVKNDIKFVEAELKNIDDPSKKIDFIHEYIEAHEWSLHIKKTLTDKYWTDYVEISHTPDASMDTIKQKIYDSEPEARKRCEQAIDKAGGCIEYFKIRCPNYQEIEYKQFPPPIEKLKYLTQRVDELSDEIKQTSENPASLFPGLDVININEFLIHLRHAENKGILRYKHGGKIILTPQRRNHNRMAVALYEYWKNSKLIHETTTKPWDVVRNNVVLNTTDSNGQNKKLNNKKLSEIFNDQTFRPYLDYLDEIL